MLIVAYVGHNENNNNRENKFGGKNILQDDAIYTDFFKNAKQYSMLSMHIFC